MINGIPTIKKLLIFLTSETCHSSVMDIFDKMELNLANKFLILGVLLYVLAGIMVMGEMNYTVFILLVAIIFLALGFFMHVKLKWIKLFKKKK